SPTGTTSLAWIAQRVGPPASSTTRSSCPVSFAPHSSQRSPAASSVCSSRSMAEAYASADKKRWSYDQRPIDLGHTRIQRAGRRRLDRGHHASSLRFLVGSAPPRAARERARRRIHLLPVRRPVDRLR